MIGWITKFTYKECDKDCIKRVLGKVDIKVRMRPYRTVRQMLVRTKDLVPTEQQTELYTEFLVVIAQKHTLDKLVKPWLVD